MPGYDKNMPINPDPYYWVWDARQRDLGVTLEENLEEEQSIAEDVWGKKNKETGVNPLEELAKKMLEKANADEAIAAQKALTDFNTALARFYLTGHYYDIPQSEIDLLKKYKLGPYAPQ